MKSNKNEKGTLDIHKFEVARFGNSSKIVGAGDHTVIDHATTRCCKTKK